jgi:Tol biopolymer transport system component
MERRMMLSEGHIAFASYRSYPGSPSNYEIFVMNADGSGEKRLTNDTGFDGMPAFSPDGKRIVFISDRGNGSRQIWIMNAEGSGQKQLTDTQETTPSDPVFSPDGTKIAAVSSADQRIYIMNADGSNPVKLKTSTDAATPAFSPDGKKIVFSSYHPGVGPGGTSRWCVESINVDCTGQTLLAIDTIEIPTEPSFSPDGRKIVFWSARDGNLEIYGMNADGSNQTRLTNNLAADESPAFSADGRKIAFTSTRDGHREIYVMNADGGGQKRLTFSTGSLPEASEPTWDQTALSIGGTENGDAIDVSRSGVFLRVTRNGKTSSYLAASVGHINIDTAGGNDAVTIGAGVIGVYTCGGAGDDKLVGGSGDDTLTGSAGRNTLFGGDGNDRLNGSSGRDFLYGDAGDDRLYGNAGNDYMLGGGNVDRLWGGGGDDLLSGGSSNDKLFGEAGNDQLLGGTHNDLLLGGQGADILNGGSGTDTADDEDDDMRISIELLT